jgi:hypothetical protein
MYRACTLQVVPSHLPSEHQNWKRPALADWKSLQEELVPDATFERWYGAQGDHSRRPNMGLLTGRASGNVFVIDLDEYKTPEALGWWHGVLAEHNNGIEPETCQQVTGGGGRQLFFRAPADWHAPTNKTPIGVDIRGQGGFAVLPPSLHVSGKPYEWKPGCSPWETEIATAPDWLLQAVLELVERYGGDQHRTPAQGPTTSTASPTEDFDAFGGRVDGRDHYMRDLIWAAVVNWYRECPIPPSDTESQNKMREAWAVYARKVKSRLPGDNATGLEQEGRGATLFAEKWRRAMGKWSTDIADAAQRPLEKDEWREATKPDPVPDSVDAETSDPIDVGDLSGEPRPREWLVKDWIPLGQITNLSGDGGVGKTLVTQQLLYSAGLGLPWLGIEVPATRGLGVFCEDDQDELHRRHIEIKADLGHAVGNPFTDTWIWPRVGSENILVTFDREGKPAVSPFFQKIDAFVMSKQVGLLILDNAADLFGGNEIIRAQVNYFVKAVCGGLIKRAKEAGFTLTVVLLSHPSQAGRNTGTGESGSTAWNNAVRSRLYLTKDEDGLPEQRILTRKKANYAASGDDVKLDLIWSDGVLKSSATAKISQTAIASIETQIQQMVDRAWDEGRPYKAKKGPRFLDAMMVETFGSRVEKGVIITALANLKMHEKITVDRVGDRRGYRVIGS